MEKSGWMRRIATCPVVMGLAALSAGAPALAGDDPVDWSDSLSRNRPWDAWLTLERAGDNAQIAAQVGGEIRNAFRIGRECCYAGQAFSGVAVSAQSAAVQIEKALCAHGLNPATMS